MIPRSLFDIEIGNGTACTESCGSITILPIFITQHFPTEIDNCQESAQLANESTFDYIRRLQLGDVSQRR